MEVYKFLRIFLILAIFLDIGCRPFLNFLALEGQVSYKPLSYIKLVVKSNFQGGPNYVKIGTDEFFGGAEHDGSIHFCTNDF